jgi:hypothetical protein
MNFIKYYKISLWQQKVNHVKDTKENTEVNEVTKDDTEIKEDHIEESEMTGDEDEIVQDQNGRNEIPLNEELEAAMKHHKSFEDIPNEADTANIVEPSTLTVTSAPMNIPTLIQSSSSPRDIFMPLISKFRSGSTGSSPKKSKVFGFHYIPAHCHNLFLHTLYLSNLRDTIDKFTIFINMKTKSCLKPCK